MEHRCWVKRNGAGTSNPDEIPRPTAGSTLLPCWASCSKMRGPCGRATIPLGLLSTIARPNVRRTLISMQPNQGTERPASSQIVLFFLTSPAALPAWCDRVASIPLLPWCSLYVYHLSPSPLPPPPPWLASGLMKVSPTPHVPGSSSVRTRLEAESAKHPCDLGVGREAGARGTGPKSWMRWQREC